MRTILDLGCGTASHGIILSKRKYNVTGVDFSPQMLRLAKAKIKRECLKIDLHKGDIKAIRLSKKFDAVISMFDVMGYQITDEMFKRALLTANVHLKKSGLFIFDCWYGPTVLRGKLKNRIKVVCDRGGEKIARYSKCKLDTIGHTAEICFITKKYLKRRLVTANRELHKMRFFFLNEIKPLLNKNGFNIKGIHPFLKLGNNVTANDWKTIIISKKVHS